jgi:hypothetical protein
VVRWSTLVSARNCARVRRLDRTLYPLWAALCTLVSANSFYRSMFQQTGGEWSAPLDDVFIHFDYARAAAGGAPFEWVAGNGFSSGNTSLTYPFILALGYRAGFTGSALMWWAAIVAATSMVVTLILLRRWFAYCKLPVITAYAAPPLLFGVGALNWTLWSGMEVAFFLAVFALAADRLLCRVQHGPRRAPNWQLAATSILAVYTRPEASVIVGCLGAFLALYARESRTRIGRIGLFSRYTLPCVAALAAQAACNRWLTGESSASGALVKLAVYNPHLSHAEKWADYLFNARYAWERNITYHFADEPVYYFILPLLAIVPLCFERTRALAILLWTMIGSWTLLLGLNGQVRWQNERYTMPAVAWLLLLAALGIGAVVSQAPKLKPIMVATAAIVYAHPDAERYPLTYAVASGAALGVGMLGVLLVRPLRVVAVAGLVCLFAQHQDSKMRGQRWFFGRAARNIRDQHTTLGRYLHAMSTEQQMRLTLMPQLALPPLLQDLPVPPAKPRVLVGDAGAILYASEWNGLDIIGLGGYHKLPFARAGAAGLGAVVELVERMPVRERPTHMAIFPSWWGILPTWFGRSVVQRFPAPGNVICGDFEHVLYEADWQLLGSGEAIQQMPVGTQRVRDSVDFGDLVDEREHDYDWLPHAANGWTTQRILPYRTTSRDELWDGGRRISAFHRLSFTLRHLIAGRSLHLVLRMAPERTTTLRIGTGDFHLPPLAVPRSTIWVEQDVVFPATMVTESLRITVENLGPEDFAVFHAYGTQ